MSTSTTLLIAAAGLAIVIYAVTVSSALLHLRRRRHASQLPSLPPLSLLKPVKGLEENLQACLRSFFEQDYPGELEIVFASAQRDDPAIALARRIAADYPEVRARFVLSDENWGLNPKVSNLQGALRAAHHDLVLQTDANVWAPPDYARSVVSEMLTEGGSLLSSLVSGIGERSLGAAIENLQLTAYVAPACCAALKVAGVPCVIGKSMLFRKSELLSLGGLDIVKSSLAEDFLLGRFYAEHGKKVILSATPIRNVNVDMKLERSLSRHGRWLKMRAVIHVPSFVVDLFMNPVPLLMLAWFTAELDAQVGAVLGIVVLAKMAVDGMLVQAVRGTPMALRHLALAPVRDILMLGVWCYATVSRSVEWRGIRFRMGPDSQLLPDEGNLPARVLRRLLSA